MRSLGSRYRDIGRIVARREMFSLVKYMQNHGLMQSMKAAGSEIRTFRGALALAPKQLCDDRESDKWGNKLGDVL